MRGAGDSTCGVARLHVFPRGSAPIVRMKCGTEVAGTRRHDASRVLQSAVTYWAKGSHADAGPVTPFHVILWGDLHGGGLLETLPPDLICAY